ETVDDVVARDHGRAATRERTERLALACRDAAGERDRERSLHYSVGSASSEASASGASVSAAGSSATASGSASTATGSSSAAGWASAATGSSSAASTSASVS